MKKYILFLTFSLALFFKSQAQVSFGISITAGIPPPPLPVYVQPACPYDGYLWIPGYWAYSDGGYFWVPGVWVLPPQPGFLWTPGYWEFAGGVYGFYPGYWGPHVGFYGGVNYGYGYGGTGFYGGRWEGGVFRYNTAVVNVNHTVVRNTYIDRTVIVHNTTVVNNRVSYNGGPHGISARPNVQEQAAARENHFQATSQQTNHVQQARSNRVQFASVNHGHPVNAAMDKPGGHIYHSTGYKANVQPNPVHTESVNHPVTPHQNKIPENNPSVDHGYAHQPHDNQQHYNPRPQSIPADHSQNRQPIQHQQEMREPPQEHRAPQEHQAPQQHQPSQEHQAPQQHQPSPQHQAPPQHQEQGPRPEKHGQK